MMTLDLGDLVSVTGGATAADAANAAAYNWCLRMRAREVGPIDNLFHPGKREAHQQALCDPILAAPAAAAKTRK